MKREEDNLNVRDLAKYKVPGYFLLINNSSEDDAKIIQVLKPHGFKYDNNIQFINEDVDTIRQKLSEVTKSFRKRHKNIGSIMVMVLASQDEDGRLWAKDKSYSSQEIISPFQKYEELEIIPKIFIFLVCKSMTESSGDQKSGTKNIMKVVPTLKERNCLICVSTETDDFINNLNKELESRQHRNEEINWTILLSKVTATTSRDNQPCPVFMSSLQHTIIYRTKRACLKASNESYRFSSYKTPGLALIFNTYEYQQPRMFSRRDGSHQSVSSLLNLFQDMKFDVKIFNDLTAEDMKTTVKQISAEDLSQFGCLLVVVMTHSIKDKLQAFDQPYDASDVWQPFLHNESLVGKPKIFLFEANAEIFNCMKNQQTTNKMKDVFIAFACLVHESPLRHLRTGNYFIHSFCEAVQRCKENNEDFLSLFIFVSKYVNEKIENTARKQTPCYVSFLTKQLIFRDTEEAEVSILKEYDDIYCDIPPIYNLRSIRINSQESDSSSVYEYIGMNNLYMRQSITKQNCMFGALNVEDKHVVYNEIETKSNFDSLLQKFVSKEENIKFIAGHLLNIIFDKDWDDKVKDVIKYSSQEEILHFIWRIIVDSSTMKENLLKMTLEATQDTFKINFLCYYLDFSQGGDKISGFPLMCLLKSSLKETPVKLDKLEQKIKILLKLGANVNDIYPQSLQDETAEVEKSAIHFAAENNMWKIVDVLLEKDADIDIEIAHKTARSIIVDHNPDKVLKTTIENEENAVKSCLFQALYDKNEANFKTIFSENLNLVNCHDGKYTLLQLAIKNKLKNVASMLFARPDIDHLAMAGYCKEPILMALNNPNFELLELFVQAASQLNLRFCNDGSTFLHHLASKITDDYKDESALEMLIQAVIQQQICISALDKNNKTALEICTEKSNILLKIILDNGGFLNIDEKIAFKLKPKFLTEYLESKIEIQDDKLIINYEFLKPIQKKIINETNKKCKKIAPEMVPFLEISKLEKFHNVLVESPFITFFLIHKWRQFAFVYLINFLMYFCFTISFSGLVYCKLNCAKNITNSTQYMNTPDITCHSILGALSSSVILSFIFWIYIFIREVFQISTTGCSYLKNFENYLEMLILLLSLLTLITPISMIKELRLFAATAIILIYVELTLLLGRHPSAELYITMFKQVSIKTLKLLFIFFSFFLAFAMSFHILLKVDDTDNDETKNIYFYSAWDSIMKTTLMAAGEFELDSITFHSSPIASKILLIVFLIFVVIVLMNLLNALAISDTQKIITEASVRCCIKKIKFFYDLECMFLGYSNDNSSKRCYGFDVNKEIRNNKDTATLHKRTRILGKMFRAHDSPYRKQNYKLDIALSSKKHRNNNFKFGFHFLSKFYTQILLQIDERYTALEIQKTMKDGKYVNKSKFNQQNKEHEIDNYKKSNVEDESLVKDEDLNVKINNLQGEIKHLKQIFISEGLELRTEMKYMKETLDVIKARVLGEEEQYLKSTISMDC